MYAIFMNHITAINTFIIKITIKYRALKIFVLELILDCKPLLLQTMLTYSKVPPIAIRLMMMNKKMIYYDWQWWKNEYMEWKLCWWFPCVTGRRCPGGWSHIETGDDVDCEHWGSDWGSIGFVFHVNHYSERTKKRW